MSDILTLVFSLTDHGAHRHLPSFPTRRSSDLTSTVRRLCWPHFARCANIIRSTAHCPCAPAHGSKLTSGSPAISCSKDRKSTRLNSSHSQISYAVFCLKKKTE